MRVVIAKRLMLMVFIMACLGLLGPVGANAATTGTQVQMAVTETPTSGADDAEDADEEQEQESEEASEEIAFAVIGFGLLVILAILAYVYFAQDQFYDLAATSLRRLGKVPPLEHVDPIARKLHETPNGDLEIDGKVALAVGQTGEYSAKSGDDIVEATWAMSDESLADVTPASPAKTVTVKAKKSGTLRLTATAEFGRAEATIHLVTVESGPLGSLPFVGKGYGSLVIAVFVAALVAVLGLVGVLGSEPVATLFGTLLGYIFAKAAQTNSDNGAGGASTGENAAETND